MAGFIHSDSSAVDVSANAPNATNYIDLLHKLLQFAAASTVATVTVNAGGTGYAVGDIVELDGGTHPSTLSGAKATFEVTDVSGGVVQAGGLRMRDSGAYATTPSTTGITTTFLGGTGAGNDDLTVDLTYESNGWAVDRQTAEVTAAVIGASAGSGYANGDTIDVIGGDTRVGLDSPQTNTPARLTVPATVTTGQSFTVTDGGIYHRPADTDEAATTVVTGSGDGLMTADLTFTDIVDTTTDIEAWLSNATSGATVGLRTFTDGSTYFNWELAMAPTYTAANNWDAQVNMSVGRYPLDEEGSYAILRNVAFNYYMRVTDRYLFVVANIDNAIYVPIWIGLGDPYATSTEYAYPALICGSSSVRDITATTTASQWGGLNLAIAQSTAHDGPAQIYGPGGTWHPFHNGAASGANVIGDNDQFHIFPGGWFDPQSTLLQIDDRIANDTGTQKQDWGSFASIATTTNAGGEDPPTETFLPTPQTGGGDDHIYLSEFVAMGIEPVNMIALSIGGAKWLDRTLNSGTLNAEDVIVDTNGDLYVVFNNCANTSRQHWFAMKVTRD